jgi:hypothetical protein
MQLYLVRILSLVVIALVYMFYDVFNKRNVPSIFAYATLAYGFLLTILYFNIGTIELSAAISLLVLGLGYIVYKIGQLGLADVIEFAAISLILPFQKAPLLLSSLSQFNLPFALTLLVNTGIVAIIIVPIYYIPKASKKLKKPLGSFITKKSIFMASLIVIAYLAFMTSISVLIGFSYLGIALLAAMMISSSLVMLFSVPIAHSMVEYVGVNKFDEGDIIAINLMDKKDISAMKKSVKGFDRLLSASLIENMKKAKIKEKFPVYKEAMPFALPIFAALVISLLAGNLLLLVLAGL